MKSDEGKIPRVGFGYDIHRTMEEGEGFPLGGTWIPAPFGLVAHSDGDVLIHALIDALFGATALGDIGTHFPDDDPAYQNATGPQLLEASLEKVREAAYGIGNIDATVIAEKPKIAPYIPEIRKKLASLMDLPQSRISVKATTHEKLGPLGASEGIAVQAVALLHPER